MRHFNVLIVSMFLAVLVSGVVSAQNPLLVYSSYNFDQGAETDWTIPEDVSERLGTIDALLRGECLDGSRRFDRVSAQRLQNVSDYLFGVSLGSTSVRSYKISFLASGCGLEPHDINLFGMAGIGSFDAPLITTGLSGGTRTTSLHQPELSMQFIELIGQVRQFDFSCKLISPQNNSSIDTVYVGSANPEDTLVFSQASPPPGERTIVDAWIEQWTLYDCDGDEVAATITLVVYAHGSVAFYVDLEALTDN